ncbi:MAG: hypothetical protein Q8L24_02315 [bacterium]|nr:hypothetical protein [bacterium]
MSPWNTELSKNAQKELEDLIVSVIKDGLAKTPEDVVRFMRLRSSRAARKSLAQSTPFFECEKCRCGKKTSRAFLQKIYKVPMSEELRKFLAKDPEKGVRDAFSDLLDFGRLHVGRGWEIKIPAPPK